MPWHVAKSAKCPTSKPWAVINETDDSVEGCHASEADANAQMKALYANVEDASRNLDAMFTLRQTDGGWEVHGADGEVLAKFDGPKDDDKAQRLAYSRAVGWLADNIPVAPVVEPVDGVTPPEAPTGALSDRWQAAADGIVFNGPTGDGRDFTACVWTWRATTAPLPLLLLTRNDMGHYGAEMCGWIDTTGDPTTAAAVGGWFHDTDAGRQARDILTAQKAYPVSVDPGEVTCAFECTEEVVDEWGSFCVDGILRFDAYEIAGLTMVPFPAFGTAAIELVSTEPAVPEPVPVPAPSPIDTQVAASAPVVQLFPAIPTKPPAEWLAMAEPAMPDDRYVPQRDGQHGIPLTITADGHVYGHAGLWGTCHVGYVGECVTPPLSQAAYAHYHVGLVTAADGTEHATGTVTAGSDHALGHLRAAEALDWYAHNGRAWADVRASNGTHGVWVSGVLRPDVTGDQIRVLRAGSLSGDWRQVGRAMELIGLLAVSTPGFPIVREALAASGLDLADVSLRYNVEAGRQVSLVASGIVRPAETALESLVASGTVERCATCGKTHRSPSTAAQGPLSANERQLVARVDALRGEIGEAIGLLRALEVRTRPAKRDAVAAARHRLASHAAGPSNG